MEKRKFILKAAIFAAICLLIISVITPIFVPIWYPGTETVKGFQQEKEDTIDVLFLGTSRTAFSASPWLLWEEYGIAAYSLGVEQQPATVSAYLLEEALKSQDIKAVAIEVMGLDRDRDYDDQETYTRENFDNMPLTWEKIKAAWQICSESTEQTFSSFIFPLLRFHDRWNNLSQENFADQNVPSRTKGAIASFVRSGVDSFSNPFPQSTGEPYQPPEESSEGLEQIIKICEENEIELVLYVSPNSRWTKEKADFYEQVAQENENVHFINFNTEEMIEEIGFDIQTDYVDAGTHVNYYGAQKMMRVVGQYLSEELQLPDHRGDSDYASWDDCVYYVEWQEKIAQLKQAQTIEECLELLTDSRFSFAIAVCDDAAGAMSPQVYELLRATGLGAPFEDGYRNSYIAVVDKGTVVYEAMRTESQEYKLTLDGNAWFITSEGFLQNDDIAAQASITVGRDCYFTSTPGMLIAVYDNEDGELVEVSAFNLYSGGLKEKIG